MIRKRQYPWIGLAILAILGAAIGLLPPTSSVAAKVTPTIGNKSENFSLNDVNAKKVELNQVIKANKVTLVNFWGIWCPYCVKEIPELVEFYKQYHAQKVEIVAVNVGDDPKKVPGFASQHQMTFPVLIDKNNVVTNLYQVTGFPSTFLLDGQGKIRDIIVGATNRATLVAKVEKILQEK